HDRVGVKLARPQAGVETGGRGLHLEAAVALQKFDEHLDDRGIIVHDEHPRLPHLKLIEGDIVLFHELDQGVAWDPAETRSRYAIPPQPPTIEATYNRLLTEVTDLSLLAGGEHALERNQPVAVRSSHQTARSFPNLTILTNIARRGA